MIEHFDRCRPYIEAALEYAGTHRIEHIEAGIEAGAFQFWPGHRSAIVTEISEYPLAKCMHFFLAGGDIKELQEMARYIEQAARRLGCTRMTLAGRRGWLRSFLVDDGYQDSWAVMAKELK